MRVILIKDCQSGKANTIVEVSAGFARNFLIPKGLAILATKENLARLARIKGEIESRQEAIKESSLELKAKLEGLKLNFKLKRQGEAVSNSVTTKQIVSRIESLLSIKLAKHTFASVSLRTIGPNQLSFKLPGGIEGRVVVLIEAD